MKKKFKNIFLNDDKMAIIAKANKILADYIGKYDITLRGLYYQFVRRDWFPESWQDPATGSTNNVRSYKKLGDIIGDGRLSGLIDWDVLGDEGRFIRELTAWDSPASIIRAVAEQYRTDMWEGMDYRPEVWIEKNALIGLVEPVTNRHRVALFSCVGYASLTAFYEAANRLKRTINNGQKPVILHLGDHDPSGCDMSRNIHEQLEMFVGRSVIFKRLALNMDQIEEFQPPPNPAKITDSRAKKYIEEHGEESWELDALEPQQFDDVITAAIEEYVDEEQLEANQEKERTEKAQLQKVSDRWDNVVGYINKLKD